ncbi:universal stress protein [Leucobacter luti]|uniref:Nucleotide-binding universal stress UspA family protein n=1 Tax=Leucobacter luti TaxID=340320 RepID=A0A4Q7TK78_9MICO|nr:universal stress protein [Leucobacter luti]MBL3700406.1 universal stress protein [Leucobacter luti]RZT60577.1 nucleotide-binding universal stress UspA family protein [Leucobacter luti]
MSEKYLIGVDGSEQSRVALAWGLARATERGATVQLLHVADDSFLSESVAFLSEAQKASEQMLEAEVAYARSLGFTGEISGSAVVGHPIAEVEEASKSADLLILGQHSGTRFAGSFFGTRAVKVAATAHCPVAVIPTVDATPNAGVVVGIDGSEASQRAIAYAAEEASFRGAPLIAVYAWMPPLTPGLEYLWSEELVESQRSAAEEAIAIGVAGLAERYPDLEVRREIIQAPPVAALVQAAEGAQLLVVGSRGRGGISRLLLGSVSHGVLQALPCPVIVTRA